MNHNQYLTDMPSNFMEHGISKVLSVRKEIIHIKHILTDIFVRKVIDITPVLEKINMSLFDYMGYMTQRMRKIHHFTRDYQKDCNQIVKHDKDRFFPTIELYNGLNNLIILDFDGVVTKKNFEELYKLCIQRGRVVICSANPTITPDWFERRNLPLPRQIFSMKGSVKKIRKLLSLNLKYDNIFYVDNEEKYLSIAWLFGINTYHYTHGKIKYYTRNTK